jgi:hypothetical protein
VLGSLLLLIAVFDIRRFIAERHSQQAAPGDARAATDQIDRPGRTYWRFAVMAAILFFTVSGTTLIILFAPFQSEAEKTRQRLIGVWQWTDTEGTTEYRADGTFNQELVAGIEPRRTTGQYQMDGNTLTMKSSGQSAVKYTLVIAGDDLTLKDDDGGVHRLKRKK